MKFKKIIIITKKYIPDIVFISAFLYVCYNPGKLGNWVGVFLKNINLVIQK